MAYLKLFDDQGRPIRVLVLNEAEDGSGTWHIPLVDSSGRLVLGTSTALLGKIGHDTTGLGHGVKTVSTVGTDEALAASTACKWVIIQAQTDNTSKVAIGATGVDATVATGNGLILNPGDWSPRIDIDNLADIYVDALVAGEGVRFLYGS